MSDLRDKVLIVTGASRGIGAAAARLFAVKGASVVLAARDAQGLEKVASEITVRGDDPLVVPTDVSDAAAVEHLVRTAVDQYGRLDGAFNNAGQGHRPTRSPSSTPASSRRTWRRTCAASSCVCAPSSPRWEAAGRSST